MTLRFAAVWTLLRFVTLWPDRSDARHIRRVLHGTHEQEHQLRQQGVSWLAVSQIRGRALVFV